MHARAIVTRVVGPCLDSMHTKRKCALLRATTALVQGGVTSLSGIALHLSAMTRLKHRLKSVDRLLGNSALEQQRWEIYSAVAHNWLKGFAQILVVVDWSDLTRDQRWQLLRASVAVEGRSLTLYEEVHPQKHLGNPNVHRRFLRTLKAILPEGCKPIVMSDAGFHAPWFKAVAAMGWQFIGRIRGRNQVFLECTEVWTPARELYKRAGTQTRDLGSGAYVSSNPVEVRVVLSKQPKKNRQHLTIYGTKHRGRKSAKNARSAREPWLLASSPGLSHLSAQGIVALYSQRMGIEQSFRDTKSLRVGLGLEVARSRSAQRLNILLLIAHLATFVQRLIGESAKGHQLELQFMATHRVSRREISVLTLARRILDAPPHYLKQLAPCTVLRWLH